MDFETARKRAMRLIKQDATWFQSFAGRSGLNKRRYIRTIANNPDQPYLPGTSEFSPMRYARFLVGFAGDILGYTTPEHLRCITWHEGPRMFRLHGPLDVPMMRTDDASYYISRNLRRAPETVLEFEDQMATEAAELALTLKEKCASCPYEAVCLMGS